MTRKVKASDYTHSVWTGKKYNRQQTDSDLANESRKVLNRHPTIGRLLARPNDGQRIASHCFERFTLTSAIVRN
jgi:hypothetical protein